MRVHNKNIPVLRFKEFVDEWVINPLINLSVNGFSNGAFNDPKKVGSGYRIVNVKDMYINGTINVNTLTRVAIDEQEFLKNRVEYGDIFFTRSSLVKEGIAYSNVNLNKADDLTYDGHLIRMRPNKNRHSPIFLYYNFSTSSARQQFIKRGKTATMTTIGQEDIAKVQITFPTLPEQQKIASFLTAIDKKVQQLMRKKELLEQYKKGVMQQLFPTTGEQAPKLRFKDENGKEYPKWEEKRLGDVCTIKGRIGYRGYTVQDIVKSGQGAITLSPSNINDGKLDFSNSTYISWFKYEESPEIKIEVNDVLLVKTGSTFGKSAFVNKLSEPATINPQLVILKGSKLFPQYLAYVIYHSSIQKQIVATVGSGAVPNLSQESISNFLVPVPLAEEQKKIATFLSSIDIKIETVTTQINQSLTFKKGLLQQMFV